MASKESIAIACDKACERIEEWVSVNVAEELTPLPRLNRDREILRKQQLETIADWLDRATVAQDDTLQQARDLITSGNWTKAQMEDILNG